MDFDDSLFETPEQEERIPASQVRYTAKRCELNVGSFLDPS